MTVKSALALFSSGALTASAQLVVPGFDLARTGFTQTGESDLDGGKGSLETSRFQLYSALSRPLSPVEGVFILPMFDYKFTDFDFDDVPAGDPFQDEDLHSLSLSAAFFSMREGSPWIYGGWARAELATDFERVDGDDLTFDLVAGAGYRFNEKFTLGAGLVAINLNGDASFFPGINFDWIVNDKLRVGFYGPTFVVAYSPNEDWLLSFREDPFGGIWNVTDDDGRSRSIDLSAFRLGLYASRRLTGDFWITAGAGTILGGELDYTHPDGDTIAGRDTDATVFGSIGLRLKAW